MKGKIRIDLTAIKSVPDSGSGMPDLGHDTYFLMKQLPQLSWEEGGKEYKLSDKYTISLVQTEAENA